MRDESINNEIDITYTSDSVIMYYREISKFPLLTKEEEKELALRIQSGDRKARQEFMNRNLRLVVNIAKRYRYLGIPLLDLIQEGNIGLVRAVDKFDVTMEKRFSTYASQWIEKTIWRAFENKSRMIRIPSDIYQLLIKYIQTVSRLEKEVGGIPTIDMIATQMGISKQQALNLQKLSLGTVSLQTLIGEEQDDELEDFIPSDDVSVEEKAILSSLSSDIQKLFIESGLTAREIEILAMSYGIGNQKIMLRKEISKIFKISEKRVKQIEMKALRKIRNSEYIKSFAEYMDDPMKALENLEEYKEYRFI